MEQFTIKIPSKINVNLADENNVLSLSNLEHINKIKIPQEININFSNKFLTINLNNKINKTNKNTKLLLVYKTLICNSVKGLTQKFKIIINLKGVGFKVNLKESLLQFKLGFSHEIFLKIPKNIIAKVFKPTQIILLASDLNEITQFAHNIKKLKKPDSYKGKGIMLSYDTQKSLKEGKRNKR